MTVGRFNLRLNQRSIRHTRALPEAERIVLQAFARWYMTYLPSALQDVNMVEAFKAGHAAGRVAA